MSKITIVGGDILEYIGGKDLSYAKEGIEFTSEKEVIFTAKKGISHGKPKKQKKKEAVVTNAMVYFRPVSKNGEFGFDWLRESDNGLAEKYDPAYKDIIESGYNEKARLDLTPTEAFERLKNQYEIIPMKFESEGDGTSVSNREYFVPYLTLFSEEYVTGEMKQQYENLFTEPKYEAELKVLLEIEEDIDRLEFDYKKEFFKIDKKVLTDKTKTAGLVVSADTSIKITCLKDLPNEMEICIYAYPKNCQQPFIERRLAGKIKVLQNDRKIRKEEKIVLVSVTTDVFGGKRTTGTFSDKSQYNLYNMLYQALVIPTIDIDEMKIILDLSKNKDFQKGGKYITDIGYLDPEEQKEGDKMIDPIEKMKKLFLCDSKNEIYEDNNYFTVFATRFTNKKDDVAGKAEDINKHNAIMFDSADSETLAHEILHGLGLYHTHLDNSPIINKNIKYVYTLKTTTNIMSYSIKKFSSWRWQWSIINSNIK